MQLHHVSIPYQPDELEAGRSFYGQTLGLAEIPRPTTLENDGAWFQLDDRELHLYIEDPAHVISKRQHFCFAVDELDSIRQRIASAGTAIEQAREIPNRPRFFCRDPAGNRLEITAIHGPYDG